MGATLGLAQGEGDLLHRVPGPFHGMTLLSFQARSSHKTHMPAGPVFRVKTNLRHTHAPLMLQAGVHPKIVSERLGHASISITMDTYSHVLPGL